MVSYSTLFADVKLLFGAFWKLFRFCDELTKIVQINNVCTINVHYSACTPVVHRFDACCCSRMKR
jgi:hypothetical protein